MVDKSFVLKWAHLGRGRNPRHRRIIEEERTTPRSKGSTASRANTVSAELLNLVHHAHRRRRGST